jgi:gliding motility-associated-like protein
MFTVVGTDYYGCTSSDSVWVNVIRDHTVRPNNVITPDGNNENDVWVVQNIENYPNNSVSVFDRWGREVFRTDSYQSDWGATDLHGKGLMDGTYYYVIEFPEINKVMKGAITVVNNK